VAKEIKMNWIHYKDTDGNNVATTQIGAIKVTIMDLNRPLCYVTANSYGSKVSATASILNVENTRIAKREAIARLIKAMEILEGK
jgi:2-methylaconitate cis-trans-isomerase PrpF